MSTSTANKYAFLDPPTIDGDLGSLGPYRVIGELGRGGMGFVFRAEDTRLKRIVALKVMNAKVAATPHSRQRFIDEARSMAAVKHDNVVTIYEVSDHRGTPFMAMEMLKGGTLEELIRKQKKFDYHQVLQYAVEMARGLGAAHAQGIIHRDIKPANIWIEADRGRVKILDFGLALAQVPFDQLAKRGSVIGTPQYLSPEQARSDPLDSRTDLYSLGVVLYELCTGELPFKAKSVPEQLIMTLVHEPPAAHQINREIPEPLGKLISRLMKKEPRHRPRSAKDLEKLIDKVALECEAKSDVALTINKLQEQLSRVVVNKPDPFAAEIADEAIEVDSFGDDLFQSLPSVPSAKASTATAATLPAPAAIHAPLRPAVIAQAKPASSGWPPYWPFLAIGGVAVVMFSIMLGAWLFSPTASERVAMNSAPAVPAETSSATPPPPAAAATPATAEPSAAAARSANASADEASAPATIAESAPAAPVQRDRPQPEPEASSPSPAGRDAGVDGVAPANIVQGEPAPQPAAEPKTVEAPLPTTSANVAETATSAAPARTDTAKPSRSNRDTGEIKSNAAKAASDTVSELASPAPEAAPRDFKTISQVVSIRTGDGRGADTTVKRGGGNREQLGENISVVVLTRGDVDVQHSYLRFDLEALKKRLADVAHAELVLSHPGGAPPAGSTLRVYGVPQEYPDNWQEVGPRALSWDNSISKAGLSEIPLLAELSFAGTEPPEAVRVKDDRLTAFIRDIGEEFVTLVLAGGSPGNKPLHFVSREGDPAKSPLLELEIATAPDSKKK
ncbi:MAG: protein kinase domain-containing protein [Planctomycetaceae bacterium]